MAGSELNTPHTAIVHQDRVTGIIGGSGTGGGATGQTDSDAVNNFDIISGPTTFSSIESSLFAASDGLGGLVEGTINIEIPIIAQGNVLDMTIAVQGRTGPAVVDLFTVLPDGTYLSVGHQFPAVGETLRLAAAFKCQ